MARAHSEGLATTTASGARDHPPRDPIGGRGTYGGLLLSHLVSPRLSALRHHLKLCETARQLLAEERLFIETVSAPLTGAPSLTARREALLQAVQKSLLQLRELSQAPKSEDAREREECAQLVSAAREETRQILEQQAEVEAIMLRHSLRRPRLVATGDLPNPALAARHYQRPASIQTEKPFDSGPG